MNRSFDVTVYGRPAPQGSKRHVGHGRMIESSKALAPWREDVKNTAIRAFTLNGALLPSLTGPLDVLMAFTLPKPQSAPKTRRTWPDRKPDLSKLVRAVEDALTDAGVWTDDARVVRLYATKSYPSEGPHALDRPGVAVSVYEVPA